MRLFTIQFDEDTTTITHEVDTTDEDVRVARTVIVPNELAVEAVTDAVSTFTELAMWATEPERFEGPVWSRPTEIDGVECDGDVLQVAWSIERNGIQTQHVAVMSLEAVQEKAFEAFDDVEDILDAASPALEGA